MIFSMKIKLKGIIQLVFLLLSMYIVWSIYSMYIVWSIYYGIEKDHTSTMKKTSVHVAMKKLKVGARKNKGTEREALG